MPRNSPSQRPGRPARRAKPDPQRARRLWEGLRRLYPEARCALQHRNAYELLVATILSAQCTDARVNAVTPELFRHFPDAAAMAQADPRLLESLIHSTGFFRNKTKSILGACRLIVERHGGQVPPSMEALLTLPGVARKTANVVLGNAFGRNDGVVVDTHVMRLSRRLGLSRHKTPPQIEQDLMLQFPSEQWTLLAHLLIFHGRQVCRARKPACADCALSADCPRIGAK